MKVRVRSTCRVLPFEYIPRLMVIHLVRNTLFWLNRFPSNDSWSLKHSPRYITTGKHLDDNKHVRAESGEYVQMHEEHDSSMCEQTIRAICLGPMGNQQGGPYFMSLATGEHLVRSRWTALPVPHEAQSRVNKFGNKQKMPITLTFADRHGHGIQDNLEEVGKWNGEDDKTYEFQEDEDGKELSCDTVEDGAQNTDDKVATSASSIREQDHEHIPSIDSITIDELAGEVQYTTTPSENHGNTGVDGCDPPVADTIESTGVGEASSDETNDDSSVAVEDTEEADYKRSERLGIESAQDDGPPLPKWTRKKKADEMYKYNNAMFVGIDIEHVFSTFDDGHSNDMFNFLTEQMFLKAGLREFGEQGAASIMKELEQLLYRKVIMGCKTSSLSSSQWKAALQYLMFLKEK